MLGLIHKKREIGKRGSGRNLHASLKNEFPKFDIKLGRDKFYEVLRNNQLLIKDIKPTRANQVWVSDITYLWLKEKDKFCYLSLITNLYSRKIVEYKVHQDLSVKGCIEALKMALKQRRDKSLDLIHGVQYCSHAYMKLLSKSNIQISMTQTGNPLENAVAERINKTIKKEFTNEGQIHFKSIDKASKEIEKYIHFYTLERPPQSINYLTLTASHTRTGSIA